MDAGLRQSLAEVLHVVPEDLTRDRVLDGAGEWDSLTILSVMVVLSESLGREIEPEEVVRLNTFGDLEDLAAAKA